MNTAAIPLQCSISKLTMYFVKEIDNVSPKFKMKMSIFIYLQKTEKGQTCLNN